MVCMYLLALTTEWRMTTVVARLPTKKKSSIKLLLLIPIGATTHTVVDSLKEWGVWPHIVIFIELLWSAILM